MGRRPSPLDLTRPQEPKRALTGTCTPTRDQERLLNWALLPALHWATRAWAAPQDDDRAHRASPRQAAYASEKVSRPVTKRRSQIAGPHGDL